MARLLQPPPCAIKEHEWGAPPRCTDLEAVDSSKASPAILDTSLTNLNLEVVLKDSLLTREQMSYSACLSTSSEDDDGKHGGGVFCP